MTQILKMSHIDLNFVLFPVTFPAPPPPFQGFPAKSNNELTNLMDRSSFSSCLEENIRRGSGGCDTGPTADVY